MAKKVAKKAKPKYICKVCGLIVSVDNVCGCVEECDIICCNEPMKKKR
ncbi:MAG: desulfoferrodoxin [Candidatus Omnitrophota bacterium]